MKTVNAYINRLAMAAIVRDEEKERISRSVFSMRPKLARFFPGQIERSKIFGSYSRNTILPRKLDENSDVDFMVLFKEADAQPQTYLNRLRRFAEATYARSEIAQSHPTILLNLNHIRIEMVPAIQTFWGGLQIPASSSDFSDWITTDPDDVSRELEEKNKEYGSRIKPMVRVLKYWNASNGYPFESFDLEKRVINYTFGFFGRVVNPTTRNLLFDFLDELDAGLFAANWKKQKVARAQQIVDEIRDYEKRGMESRSVNAVQRLLPPWQ